MLQNLYCNFLNLFFPETCIFCRTGGRICCAQCFSNIPQNPDNRNKIFSIYKFSNHKINKLIWQMKYHHTGNVAQLFGPTLANYLTQFLMESNSPEKTPTNIYLIPIPLNQADKRMRNHAELLAQEIKNNLPATCTQILNNLLVKNSKLKQSHTKELKERLENVRNAFSLNPKQKPPEPLEQNIYIIVDDVTTSGATINAARKILSKRLLVPESEILAITIAH